MAQDQPAAPLEAQTQKGFPCIHAAALVSLFRGPIPKNTHSPSLIFWSSSSSVGSISSQPSGGGFLLLFTLGIASGARGPKGERNCQHSLRITGRNGRKTTEPFISQIYFS